MKAAIVGVNGYLGQHLASYLIQLGWSVCGYGRQQHPFFQLNEYRICDVTSNDGFDNFDFNVDFIFYFSAVGGTTKAFNEYKQFIQVNEIGLLNLLSSAIKRSSNAHIAFPSTRLIYKGNNFSALKEEDEKQFKSVYALNKWFGETILQQYSDYFNTNYTIYRLCIPFGNNFNEGYSYGTIGFFLSRAIQGKDIILYGDGNLKRTFTHVNDFCCQITQSISLIESKNTIYNLTGETYSLKEIAGLIANRYNVSVQYQEWPEIDLKLESGDTVFDGSKIEKLLNYKIKNTFLNWASELK